MSGLIRPDGRRWVARPAGDSGGGTYVDDLDGTAWNAAARPPRWHRCRTQTVGFVLGGFVRRCACGAIAIGYPRGGIAGGLVWCERNCRPAGGEHRHPVTHWVRTPRPGKGYIEHRDGIAWPDVPRPRRWHRCWAQTRGYVGDAYVRRCPCGAIASQQQPDDRPVWLGRNSRRRP